MNCGSRSSAAKSRIKAPSCSAEELIASRSPEHILSLGFAIVHRGDETVTSAKGLSSGDTLRVELSDGTFDATVK